MRSSGVPVARMRVRAMATSSPSGRSWSSGTSAWAHCGWSITGVAGSVPGQVAQSRVGTVLGLVAASAGAAPSWSTGAPTTATTCRSFRPVRVRAREIPSAQLSELEACDDSTTSCSLSERCG